MADESTKTTGKQRLLLKILAASKSIKAVDKDGSNDFNHYNFQSEAAIKAAVKPALEDNGLMIFPTYEIVGQREKGKNWVVDVMGTFTITDGAESFTVTMPASGTDVGEKATVKACTTAQKYMYKQLFNISDRDTDPDAESVPATNQASKYPPADPKMIEALKTLAADTAQKMGADYKQFCKNVFVAAHVDVRKGWNLDTQEYKRVDATIAQMAKG